MPLNPPKRFTAADITVGNDWQKTSPTPGAGTGRYAEIPTLAQWKKDSLGASPSRDPLLTRIDALVEAIAQAADAGAKTYLVADLYFVLVEYLGPTDSKKQKPAAANLLVVVALKLSDAFNCSVNTLPRELERWLGRGLTFQGYKIDVAHGAALYLRLAEIQQYKLHFQDCKVWQLRQREEGSRNLGDMVLADSSWAAVPWLFDHREPTPDNIGKDRKYFGGFVIDMKRDVYMAQHSRGWYGLNRSFCHSTYLSGNPVLGAGAMRIVNGVIVAIGLDSGHYRPAVLSIINVLQKCLAHGIDISKIQIQDHYGVMIAYGGDFMKANGNWDAMRLLRQANERFTATEYHEKNQYENVIRVHWMNALKNRTCTPDRAGRLHFIDNVLPEGAGVTYACLTEKYLLSVLTRSGAPLSTDAQWAFAQWINYMNDNNLPDTSDNRRYFSHAIVVQFPEKARDERTVLLWLQEAYASKNLPTDTPANSASPVVMRGARPVAKRSSIPTMPPPPPPGRMAPPPPPGRPGRATVARRSTLRPPDITRF